MGHLWRRHLWVFDLIGIIIGAALAGHSVANWIASRLPPPLAPASRSTRHTPAIASATSKSIEGIVGRNIFCSTCADTPVPERTRRALTLLAIMLAPPPADPRWSLAIVRDDEAATTGPYGVGATLADATITDIENVRVVLDAHGRPEFLELLPRRPDIRRARAGATFDGTRQTGAHSYEIRRAVVDQFLAGGITPPWPRVVPQARDGEPVGFRLFGIAGDGPFAALGLASGDLLLQVNGGSLATPDAALAAFTALRAASHVSLSLVRSGRIIRMDYEIR